MKKQTTKEAKPAPEDKSNFALTKINWVLIGVSIVLIIFGFILMTGAPSGETFNPDIFSKRRITIGPMISLFGFLFMIVAIMWRSKKAE
jgi:hypothetical protein